MQLRHYHVDEDYGTAVFRYVKELAVKRHDICSVVFQDDKHSKIGEPGYPVAAIDRGKSVLVGRDVPFAVANHDFKLVPSVALVCDIPSMLSEGFYGGQLVVTLSI